MDFKEAIKLVELRGRLMQEAVPAGTGQCMPSSVWTMMLSPEPVKKLHKVRSYHRLTLTRRAVVIAGEKDAVERAGHYVRKRGKTCTAVVGQCAVTLCINEAGC